MSSLGTTPPTRADFDAQLKTIIDAARADGRPYVDVVARDLHKLVGGYPVAKNRHRVPQAVAAMRALVSTMHSEVLFQSPERPGCEPHDPLLAYLAAHR